MGKTNAGPVSAGRLKSFVERVEKLLEERHAIQGDIRDVLSEAKGVGYDVKTLRWLIQERKVDSADRDERDALRDTYAHALGMAVELVQVDGLSLRDAAKKAGVSKSSLHRALAVPEVSQTEPAGGSNAASEVAGSADGARGDETSEARGRDAAELLDSDGTQRGQVGPPCNAGPGAERHEPDGRGEAESASSLRVAPDEASMQARSEVIPSEHPIIDNPMPQFLRRR